MNICWKIVMIDSFFLHNSVTEQFYQAQKMVIPKWSQSLKRPTWIEKIKVQQLCMYISTEWWQFQLQIGKYNVYFPKHLHFQIHKSNFISFAHSFTKKGLLTHHFISQNGQYYWISVKTFLQNCVWKIAFWISKWAFCSSQVKWFQK